MKILEKFCRTIYLLNFIKIRLGLVVSEKIYSWFGKVMSGCVWFEKTSIWNFCEIFIKIWFVLAVLEKIYSWFGLVRFGMVWYGLVWFETTSNWSFCEIFIKIQLVLAVLEKIYYYYYTILYTILFVGLDSINRHYCILVHKQGNTKEIQRQHKLVHDLHMHFNNSHQCRYHKSSGI